PRGGPCAPRTRPASSRARARRGRRWRGPPRSWSRASRGAARPRRSPPCPWSGGNASSPRAGAPEAARAGSGSWPWDRWAEVPWSTLRGEEGDGLDAVRRRRLVRRVQDEGLHDLLLFVDELRGDDRHAADERGRLEILHELGEGEGVARAALDAERDRRPLTRVGDAGEPGVGWQRAPDLVQDVRPDVAACIDLLDELEPVRDAVAPGLEPLGAGDHGRVVRGGADGALDGDVELVPAGAGRHEHPASARDERDPAEDCEETPAVDGLARLGGAQLAPPAQRETGLTACGAAGRSRIQVDFDHGHLGTFYRARRSASPTESMSMGATSSRSTVSATSERTATRSTGLATSVRTPSRPPIASTTPGTRAAPPERNTRPIPWPPDCAVTTAAARSIPMASSSARSATKSRRSPPWPFPLVRPWTTSSAWSAVRPRSRWSASRSRREPKGMSRTRTGTPSSSTFTLVVSCPMLTSATMPLSMLG